MTTFPSPPYDQIPLAPGDFLAADGFIIGQFPHDPRVKAGLSYADGFGGIGLLRLTRHDLVVASITVNDNPANFGDDEQFALNNVTFSDWFHRLAIPIAGKKGGYTSVSNMDAMRASIGGADAWYWSAHYGWRGGGRAGAHRCGPNTCGFCSFEVDATQCYDEGPNGENIDITVCRKGFLGINSNVIPVPTMEDELLTSVVSAEGHLHVFRENPDGSVDFTYQKKGETTWLGGSAGKSIANFVPFAPARKK